MLRGLDKRLQDKINIPFHIAEDPLHSVASGAGSFVTDVEAIKGITFSAGDSNNQDFGFVASLAENSGASFVNGVHAYTSADDGKKADFTIWGEVTATTSTFVSGLSETEASGGDVVTSVFVGDITLAEGTLQGVLSVRCGCYRFQVSA